MTEYEYSVLEENLKVGYILQTLNTGTIYIGGTYDPVNNVFMPPPPYPSWIFDLNTKTWQSPVPRPDDGIQKFLWNESEKKWVGTGEPFKSNQQPKTTGTMSA